MQEVQRKIRWEDNKKMFNKQKQADSKKYNDNVLKLKDQSKRVLYEQKRNFERSLLEKAKEDLEIENREKQVRRMKMKEQNDALMKENERMKSERKKLKAEEIIREQEYSKEYVKMLEKQELDNKNRKVVLGTLTTLPANKQNNIYGLTVAQEDTQMLKRMKQEEAQDKAKKIQKKMDKLQQQKELRDYLNFQLKEKQDRQSMEKAK